MINRNNYSEFILDYLDGNLSPLGTAELMLFLEQNINLRNEFDLLVEYKNDLKLTSDPGIDFPKSLLKKECDLSAGKIDQLILDELEYNLSAEDNTLLNLYKGELKVEKSRVFFMNTILVQDESVLFPGKDKIKKRPGLLRIMYPAMSAAAAIILALLLILNFSNRDRRELKNELTGDFIPVTIIVKEDVINPELNDLKKSNVENKTLASGIGRPVKLAMKRNIVHVAAVPVIQLSKIKEEIIIQEKMKLIQPDHSSTKEFQQSFNFNSKETFPDLADLIMHKINKMVDRPERNGHSKVPFKEIVFLGLEKISKRRLKLHRDESGDILEIAYTGEAFEFNHKR